MNTKLVIGTNIEKITQKLVNTISSLPPNKVVQLSSNFHSDIIRFLSSTLNKIETVFGLKLVLKSKQSMAHCGWLYSHYLDACAKLKIDPLTAVTLYSNGYFREFQQFEILESEVLLLGLGQSGREMLTVILQAESQFDPDDFDTDGYIK